MAERFFGIDRGEMKVEQVTEGSSSTATTDVEVRVDLAANQTRDEVLHALMLIHAAIMQANWPPA